MSDKSIVYLLAEESKKEKTTCFWCGAEYYKDEDHEPARGHCPNCGGTLTTEMGPPKSSIGKIYDVYRNPHFDPKKVKNEELLKQIEK